MKKVVPSPRDVTHTVDWFLKTIRRECDQYVDKFKTWEELFSSDGRKLEEMGIHCRARKKILFWTEKYRQGFDPFFIPPSRTVIRKAIKIEKSKN